MDQIIDRTLERDVICGGISGRDGLGTARDQRWLWCYRLHW
jgi:hypothetical protein